MPVWFESIQIPTDPTAETSSPGIGGFAEGVLDGYKDRLAHAFTAPDPSKKPTTIIILDGFLLLGKSMCMLQPYLDIKLLLRSSFSSTKCRREARAGYTVDDSGGWWVDPEGYVEDVVWPGYVEEHAFLFDGGDVEGNVREDVARDRGVEVGPLWVEGGGKEVGLGEVLGWVVDVVVVRRVGEGLRDSG